MFHKDFVWGTVNNHMGDGMKAGAEYENQQRCQEDIALMKYMGIKHCQFTLNWSYILPRGTGEVNQNAITRYRDILQAMLHNGITPYMILLHREYPEMLHKQGGWLNPESPEWFGYYAKVVAGSFSDLCKYFVTMKEPQYFCEPKHRQAIHTLGYELPIEYRFQIAHNMLKAHGSAVKELQKHASTPVQIGFAATGGVELPQTAWFLDPVILGDYPEEDDQPYKKYLPEFTSEDMELINQPIDFLWQNFDNEYYAPESFYREARHLYERYQMPIYITGNGVPCHDTVSEDGRVHDQNRITLFDRYLGQVQKAIDDGVDIRGYFTEAFLDNFAWEKEGQERRGIIFVDSETQKRIVKDSAYWYKEIIESNGSKLSINQKPKPILFLKPVLKEMIWGGSRLKTEFNYTDSGEDMGECWGISAHANGDDAIEDNHFKGKTLSDLWKHEQYLFGNLKEEKFPLLVKIIDAKEDLSIQVHPNDEYANTYENGALGKTECWYIIDCPKNAELVIGHNARTKEELRQMIENGRWEEFIRRVPIKKGDFIQINPGTVHAITGGCMILETQQNSDITYRVYDYDRLSDGRPRQLHVRKSMDVIEVPAKPVSKSIKSAESTNMPKNEWIELIRCDKYTVYKMVLNGEMAFTQEHPFLNMSIIKGSGIINGQVIRKGNHFILPFEYGRVEMSGELEVIASTVAYNQNI